MTKGIVTAVICGILAGYLALPDAFLSLSEPICTAGLCLLLFFIGFDMGREGKVVEHFKKAGWRMLIFPFAIMAGTFFGATLGALILPDLSVRDAMAVGAGFGWYSLAPILLAKYSASLSAVSFLHNIMREVLAIVLIPIVAKKIGHLETISLPGSSSMDVCLPIVEKCTHSGIVIYSFLSGAVMALATPLLVGFLIGA